MIAMVEQPRARADGQPSNMVDLNTDGLFRAPAGGRSYRGLFYGERAVRRACPRCHDRHAALVAWRTWTLQCRACGHVFERPFLYGSREAQGRAPSPLAIVDGHL